MEGNTSLYIAPPLCIALQQYRTFQICSYYRTANLYTALAEFYVINQHKMVQNFKV